MIEYIQSLAGIEKFYFGCALFGGSLFVIRTVLSLVGIQADDDPDAALGDADVAFKFLSIHGLTAFFMMFGLVALALSRESQAGPAWSMAGGVAAGVFTTWIIGRLFLAMKRLQSDGTLRIDDAVGHEGSVYLTIRAGQSGQVRISIKDRLRHLDAIAEEGGEIPTGTRVSVVRVLEGRTLVVRKV